MNITQTGDDAQKADDYPVYTSQEIDAISRGLANGRRGRGYTASREAGAMTYSNKMSSHIVRLSLTDDELRAGLGISYLEAIVREMDSDAVFAMFYILRQLAPPSPLVGPDVPQGWFNLDDIIEAINWAPRGTEQRRMMHGRIWQYIKFCERAVVTGQRTKKYINRSTNKEIPTFVEVPLWKTYGVEWAEQGTLPFAEEVPVRVQIQIAPQFVELLTSPVTAQYLPMGERIASIAGGKPSGAWARSIGLALMSFWRRHRSKALAFEIVPTRRELLNQYPPTSGAPEEILNSNDPLRAVEFWCGALQHLADSRVLAREGEVVTTAKAMRASLPRQGWKDKWLDEPVRLTPTQDMREAIELAGSPQKKPSRAFEA